MDGPHPQYEVTAIKTTSLPDAEGRYVRHRTVHFMTPSGTEDHVTMRADVATPHNVHNAIAYEVANIEGIHALGHGAPPPPA